MGADQPYADPAHAAERATLMAKLDEWDACARLRRGQAVPDSCRSLTVGVAARLSRVPGPSVVVVDHHDSYTWNLVHLVAAVTGALPTVVEHDEASAERVLGFSHVVLSPGPGTPTDPADFAVGREVLLAGTGARARRLPRHAGSGDGVRRRGRPRRARARRPDGGDPRRARRVRRACRRASRPCATTRWPPSSVPDALEVTARGDDGTVMGVRHRSLPLEGVQFHPESVLSEHGALLVANFLGLADG